MNILHLVLNEFVNDQRVHRSASVGLEFGEVFVFALHREGLMERENGGEYHVRRFRLKTRGWSKNPAVQVIKYAEAVARMARAARRIRPRLVHAHDLSALPIGYLAARLAGARLIYDSHELWSGAVSMERLPVWIRRIGLFLERRLAARADTVITVCDSIADVMAQTLGIPRPTVIRNLPEWKSNGGPQRDGTGPLRGALGLAPEIPILLYQGGWGRGVDCQR